MPISYLVRIGFDSAPDTVVETIRTALPPTIGFIHFERIDDDTQEIYFEIECTPERHEMTGFIAHRGICDHLTAAIERVHPGVVRDMRVIALSDREWYVSGYSNVNQRYCPFCSE